MKTRLSLIAASLLMGAAALSAQIVPDGPIPQGSNPGIAVAGSASVEDLPQAALKFINHHFKGLNISKVEREYTTGGYDVDFVNGMEMEFNSQGKVLEIDAPDGTAIAPDVVRALLPRKAYDNLRRNGSANLVSSIDFTYNKGRQVKVETVASTPQEILLDFNGNILLIEEDD